MAAAVTIAPGLHRIDTPLGDRFASLYVVAGEREALLYDTGVDGTIPDHVLPALAELGIVPESVRTVVLSHADVDHFGGVADARERFPNARIVAGAHDRPLIEDYGRYLSERADSFEREYGWHEDGAVLDWCRSVTREVPLDDDVSDGEEIDLGGRIVVIRHVPGHSHGHLAIEVPDAAAILVADAVLGASVNLVDGTPAFPPTYRYVDEYLATIDRLERDRHELLLTAHYPLMRGEAARAFLAESRAFVERLDALVLASLRAAPDGLTLAELLAELNPVAGDWPDEGTEGALAFPVVGHLERLAEQGRLERAGARLGVPVWRLA